MRIPCTFHEEKHLQVTREMSQYNPFIVANCQRLLFLISAENYVVDWNPDLISANYAHNETVVFLFNKN